MYGNGADFLKLRKIFENDILKLDIRSEEIYNIIQKDCQQFLYNSKDLKFCLYRGIRNVIKGDFLKFTILQNRSTLKDLNIGSLGQDFFKGFNDSMKKYGFKANRSNSVFCTGNLDEAYTYGDMYNIFIIGDYNISWSDEIYDYATYYVEKIKKIDYEERSKYIFSYDEGYNFFEEYRNTYRKSDIYSAIKSDNEILINCKEYYAVKKDIVDKMLKLAA